MYKAKEIEGVVYRVKHLTGGWLVESLWTAYCLHHGLDADTKAYDDDLMEVWKVVAEEEADTANWSSFGSFGTFMCAELV